MKRVLLFITVSIIAIAASAQTLPAGFFTSEVSIGSSWSRPVNACFSKDGTKLFISEQNGKVFLCTREANGNYKKQAQPIIDISDEVGGWRDFGLLGFALDPSFESNGRIYLLYVVDRHYLMTDGLASNGYNPGTDTYYNATIGRVTRYTVATSNNVMQAIPASRKILLGESKSTGIPILHESHGTGGLVFAADGTLLLTCGDGASYNVADGGSISHTYFSQGLADGIIRPEENVGAFRAQMLTSHNGKLLRINPENGDGVSSNPFFDAGAPRSPKSRVWAFGFRNPFRVSVKPGSGSTNPSTGDIGEVFVGDVGWGTWEELNVVKAPGTNFGWPLFEGQTSNADYLALNTRDAETPNPFGPCSGRTTLRFEEMLRQDNAAKDKSIYNPCNSSQLIGSHNRYIHARPAIDWRHGQNSARVGRFNSSGVAISPAIGTPESEVIGTQFGGNCSAGGIWYTGTGNTFPAEYNNTFIVADYAATWIRRLTMEYTDVVTKVDNFGTNMGYVVCLAENSIDGSIVYVNVGTTANNGTVRKISYGGNVPPVAIISADKYFSSGNNLNVHFDGTGSYDQDGNIASYSWNFGDPTSANNTSTSSKPNHTFSSTTGPKKFVVTLTVTDDDGTTMSAQFIVSVRNTPPEVSITSPEKNSKYKVGTDTTYMRAAIVSDNEQSGSQLVYEWQTTLVHNNHVHPESTDGAIQSPTYISRIGCNGDDYSWLVTLNVTDAAGLSTIDSSQIFPDCAGTLPIFLHKFSVTQAGSANLIKWTTELEQNMEYFELERSTDGINFRPIDKQPATNTPGPNKYAYTDNGFLPGTNYYRLRMVEAGDVISYSIIIKTFTEGEKNVLRIAPNPVINDFSLQYFSAQEETVTVEIKDINGRVLKSFKESVNKGQNLVYIQSPPNWAAGVYFISVRDRNETQQLKFVKVK
jgi:glucose/arabinose dehydrogenase